MRATGASETLEQEVRVNLVYREFTRIGTEKVLDAKVVAKIARVLGPSVVEELHRRIVELARENKLIAGRKMRVDTTVRRCDIVLYLAISLKTLIAGLQHSDFAEPALDS
jgi:hypothetical protein